MSIDQTKIDQIIAMAKGYGATRLIFFGSATEMPMEARDINLACDGIPGWHLIASSGILSITAMFFI